ncbi:MAG TPA: peptide deformylase [Gammaproteobacteria bacterium]|nr:peptide deformylase [Gammaproteobacteria bacterium]
MAVRKILLMGHPRLLEVARPVDRFDTPELHALVQDLLDTMRAEDGAGLAAPQIGVGLRVVVFGFEANPRYPEEDAVPRTVLVNPVIEALSDEREEGWEGCLSVPGLRGVVSRYAHIRYSGVDPQGTAIQREAHGFHARVVQHECDHLDGILYPQRMTDLRLFGYNEALEASGHLTAMPCDTVAE